MGLRQIGWNNIDRTYLAAPVKGTCEHGNEPKSFLKCCTNSAQLLRVSWLVSYELCFDAFIDDVNLKNILSE